jgi:hypothetical protein
MTSWQDRAKSFGGAADEYERMRPGIRLSSSTTWHDSHRTERPKRWK